MRPAPALPRAFRLASTLTAAPSASRAMPHAARAAAPVTPTARAVSRLTRPSYTAAPASPSAQKSALTLVWWAMWRRAFRATCRAPHAAARGAPPASRAQTVRCSTRGRASPNAPSASLRTVVRYALPATPLAASALAAPPMTARPVRVARRSTREAALARTPARLASSSRSMVWPVTRAMTHARRASVLAPPTAPRATRARATRPFTSRHASPRAPTAPMPTVVCGARGATRAVIPVLAGSPAIACRAPVALRCCTAARAYPHALPAFTRTLRAPRVRCAMVRAPRATARRRPTARHAPLRRLSCTMASASRRAPPRTTRAVVAAAGSAIRAASHATAVPARTA